jgi:hypothetical protein
MEPEKKKLKGARSNENGEYWVPLRSCFSLNSLVHLEVFGLTSSI